MSFSTESVFKSVGILFGILLFFIILYLGRIFLIPLAISGLFAMLLLPMCAKLEKWRWPKGLAAFSCTLIIIIIISGILTLLLIQLNRFANDLPQLQSVANAKLDSAHDFIADVADIPPDEQKQYIQQQINDFFNSVASHITNVLMTTTTFIVYFILVIVYTFLFLLYRSRLKNFILKIFHHDDKTNDVIHNITSVANSYITGVFIVVLILSVVNSLGLYIIGIQHPVFFGVLAGMLNIIPFIGSLVGSLIPVFIALLTEDSLLYPVVVAIFFFVVQQIESYFLTPNITGSKVKLNPLASIVALMLGGLVWGIAGMILFIPYLGILKVIFDHINQLEPYAYVIGKDENES